MLLAALHLQLHELWRIHIPLSRLLDDLAAEAEGKTEQAFVVGIDAPAGAGKSTFVQLIKFLLAKLSPQRCCVAVSHDDFCLSRAERRARGIPSRLELARDGCGIAPIDSLPAAGK